MFDYISAFMEALKGNIYENIIYGMIMVSAIIVLIGLLKPLVFDKIKWKPLRKAMIAVADITCCFVATAIAFWSRGASFEYYLISTAVVFVATVVVYWFYENTCFRDLIHKIGSITIKKAISVFTAIVENKDAKEIKKEIDKVQKELKTIARNELSVATKKVDKELKNL